MVLEHRCILLASRRYPRECVKLPVSLSIHPPLPTIRSSVAQERRVKQTAIASVVSQLLCVVSSTANPHTPRVMDMACDHADRPPWGAWNLLAP